MKRLTSVLLLVPLLFMLISCANVEEPVFRNIQGFKIKKLGLQQAEIGCDVVYFNPNNFGVRVKEAVVDVYFDSTFIGKFSQSAEIDVDKKAEFKIPFEGAIPIAKALQLKLEDVTNKDILVRAEGSVKVGKAGVFVNRDIKYNGKHRLDLSL